MPEKHAAAEFVNLFPTEDIPRIVQNVQNCCNSLARISLYETENNISKRLYRQICQLPEYRRGPIVPLWESWTVNLTELDAEITGRADILFLCGGLETYFLIEAKRLYVTYPSGKTEALVTDYINDGMMRYVTSQYASKMTEGAMLGYVCNGTVPVAKYALSAEVDKQAVKLRLAENGAWQESALAVAPPVDETCHKLDNRDFTMYHILTKV
jgi:hypothetical protein